MANLRVSILAAALAASMAGLALTAAPAAAQSPCGQGVTVQRGDTLARIARACGVSLSELIAANRGINPDALRPGMTVAMPGYGAPPRGGAERPGRPPAGESYEVYVVRPGDTLAAIARRTGMSVPAIVSLNPGVNPNALRVGERLRIIADAPVERPRPQRVWLEIDPAGGAPGSVVSLEAGGFAPGERLTLLYGRSRDSLESFGRLRADRRGEARADIEVPEWSPRRGDTMLFAIRGESGRTQAVSEPFRIAWRGPGGPGRIAVTGTMMRQSAECPLMRGDDGRTYSLAGDIRGFRPGDRLHVEGRRADMSFCMQGTTIDVRRIEPAD